MVYATRRRLAMIKIRLGDLLSLIGDLEGVVLSKGRIQFAKKPSYTHTPHTGVVKWHKPLADDAYVKIPEASSNFGYNQMYVTIIELPMIILGHFT